VWIVKWLSASAAVALMGGICDICIIMVQRSAERNKSAGARECHHRAGKASAIGATGSLPRISTRR